MASSKGGSKSSQSAKSGQSTRSSWSKAKRQASTTSQAQTAAESPSPGGSELHAAEVEKAVKGAQKADPVKEAHPTAVDPSPGGSDMHAEAVRKEVGVPKPKATAKKDSVSSSVKGAQVTLRGRFSPGTEVQLVKVAGAHVLRTAPGDEVVATKTVDENGHVQFSSGVKDGDRYLIRGYQEGFPLEIRARGRSVDDDSEVLAQDPVGVDEVRTRDGRVFPTRGHRLPHPSEL